MKLKKRQMAGLAIVVLGIAAIVVDRVLVLPRSSSAEMSASASEFAVPRSATTAANGSADATSQKRTISQRIDALWSTKNIDLDEVRDAFSLTAVWHLGQETAARPPAEPLAAVRFAQSHQLKAVILNTAANSAYVNDRFLGLGEQLDGGKLTAVDEESATFEVDGKTVVLRLTPGETHTTDN